MSRVALVACAVVLAACGKAWSPPPAPTDLRAVTIKPVVNKTGDPLLVSGGWMRERVFGQQKQTVPDVLANDVAGVLRDRGIEVLETGTVGPPAIEMTVERWEIDGPTFQYVMVSLRAVLREGDTVKWKTDREHWYVGTRGAPSAGEAYAMASREVAATLFADWHASAAH